MKMATFETKKKSLNLGGELSLAIHSGAGFKTIILQ